MEIIWDYEALDDLEAILCYIEDQYSIYEVRHFRQDLIECMRNLTNYPNIGKVEPLLKDCVDKKVRYITVGRRCKLIYLFMPGTIFVVGLWDSRHGQVTPEYKKRGRKSKIQ
ncbi:type II toxin-antitoxin system RelE/ParE family toxin [uncultured Bacteroides sp.]|uniref:type II toxin-antitoxin system RelE/ParE family toxin n=1 Tax=uncultured Bacteroides sp. TaxID=162156 RepID=UPI0025EE3F0C|nr:type II toxin-antitoxin system RelE/ParE family toxin [uncultured Bacteroides sp.]